MKGQNFRSLYTIILEVLPMILMYCFFLSFLKISIVWKLYTLLANIAVPWTTLKIDDLKQNHILILIELMGQK